MLLWKVKASMSMDRTWAEHSWLCQQNQEWARSGRSLRIPSMRARRGRGHQFQLPPSPPRLCPLPNPDASSCLLTPLLSVGLFIAFEVLTYLHFLCIWASLSSVDPGGQVTPEGGTSPQRDLDWDHSKTGLLSRECDKRFLGTFFNWRIVDIQHGKSKRVPEKHLFLLYWLCQSLWLCGSQ